MFSKDNPVGFNITLIAVTDREHNDQVQISGDVPRGADAKQLAETLATMRDALWLERQAVNARLLAKSEAIKCASEKRVAEFRAAGKPVDDEMVNDHFAALNSSIVKQTAEDDALRGMLNGA